MRVVLFIGGLRKSRAISMEPANITKVCVLYAANCFPPIDIQRNQCPRRCLVLERDQRWFINYVEQIHTNPRDIPHYRYERFVFQSAWFGLSRGPLDP